jgi:hypothetical protein
MSLRGIRRRAMLCRMAEADSKQMAVPATAARVRSSSAKFVAIKIIILTVLGLGLGITQGWASSRHYKPDHIAGFHSGVLHGMMMPAALPGLLMGQNLSIYAPNNTGRPYNIGFCLGINVCGMVFFGIGFWPPRKAAGPV